MIESPDEPAASGGAEPVPAAQPVSVPAAEPVTPPAAAPAAAVPPASTVPPRKGLPRAGIIGIIAGGVVIVVLAVLAVVLLVLPAVLGGGTVADKTIVTDISTKPQPSWRYSWAGKTDTKYLNGPSFAAVGDHQFLVWSTFNSEAWNDSQPKSQGWYEGFDQQYTDGVAAGQKYNADYNTWEEDTTGEVEQPDASSYYPSGEYENSDYIGFQDGFDDALDDTIGANKLVKPVAPTFVPSIALVDSTTGAVVWRADLSKAVDHATYASSISAADVPGSNAVAVSVSINPDKSGSGTTVVTLDRSSGKVISSLDSDGPSQLVALGGKLYVSTSSKDGKDPVVGRYSVGSLDNKPDWQTDIDSLESLTALDSNLLVTGSNDGEVLDPATGKSVKWGGDIDDSTNYSLVGSNLIRIKTTKESDATSYKIEAYGTDGHAAWNDSVDADRVFPFAGTLFTADAEGDSGAKNLERINPSNGQPLWTDSYDEKFQTVVGVSGNYVLLYSDSKIIVLNLSNGQEAFSQEVGSPTGVFLGSSLYYLPTESELVAYNYGTKGIAWRYDLDKGESVVALGTHLAVVNETRGTLVGLKAR